MSGSGMITTFVGSAMFPFAIAILWGRWAEKYGAVGGWLASAFIVGTIWSINHGVSMIVQGANSPWIDMAWAAAIGLLVNSTILGGNIVKALPNLLWAVVGGTIGGFVLSCLGK